MLAFFLTQLNPAPLLLSLSHTIMLPYHAIIIIIITTQYIKLYIVQILYDVNRNKDNAVRV